MTALDFILLLGVIVCVLCLSSFLLNWYGYDRAGACTGLLAVFMSVALLTFLIMLQQLFTLSPLTIS